MGANDLGIDLGTVNTRIYHKTKGLILDEPTVIAMESFSDRVLAVGSEAKMMLGRTPDTVSAVMPLSDGVIANFDKTSVLLGEYVKRVKKGFGPVRAVVTVPYKATAVERMAVEDAALTARIKKIHLLEEPLAAAIGLNLPIFEPKGCMIVDIGGGTTEVSIISLGGIVAETSSPCCGIQFDRDIVNYIRKTYSILIGDQAAEELKLKLGSAVESELVDFMTVSGRDLIDGLPLNVTVSSDEIREAMSESVTGVLDAIKATLEHVDPELVADIIESGIILVGGSALLPGWTELIFKETGVHTEVAVNPTDCVAIGAGRAVDMLDELKKASSLE